MQIKCNAIRTKRINSDRLKKQLSEFIIVLQIGLYKKYTNYNMEEY